MEMITRNERAVLQLLSQFGTISRMKFVKLMFLISQEHRLYDFVPYRYGPFSFQMYHDLLHLEREGYLHQMEEQIIFHTKKFPKPEELVRDTIGRYSNLFALQTDTEMVDYVYPLFPEYTMFSEIRRLKDYKRDETGIVTIGYEGKSIDRFLSQLVVHKVHTVIDVRKNPSSRKYGFSRTQLQDYLGRVGIEYLSMAELGIESEARKNLSDMEIPILLQRYASELPHHHAAIDTIQELGKTRKVALLCFEANPAHCHRGVIAEALQREGKNVVDL
jgi:uncharacterized protein (DUF488 family)